MYATTPLLRGMGDSGEDFVDIRKELITVCFPLPHDKNCLLYSLIFFRV
jgi:hypothetical protein